MEIYVDDVRELPAGFDLLFKTGADFIKWLKDNPNESILLLSLDHDFSETDNINGTEFSKEIVSLANQIRCVEFHSDDYNGIANMYQIFRAEIDNPETKCHALRRINPKKVGYDENGRQFQFKNFDARDYLLKK